MRMIFSLLTPGELQNILTELNNEITKIRHNMKFAKTKTVNKDQQKKTVSMGSI